MKKKIIAFLLLIACVANIGYHLHRLNKDLYDRFPDKPRKRLRKTMRTFFWRSFRQQYPDMEDDTPNEQMDVWFLEVYEQLYPA